MLTVTQAARVRLAEKLEGKQSAANRALRCVRHQTRAGWTFRLDKVVATDVAFAHDGRTVLVLDEKSSEMLRNKMLDIRETDEGPRLRLRGNQ